MKKFQAKAEYNVEIDLGIVMAESHEAALRILQGTISEIVLLCKDCGDRLGTKVLLLEDITVEPIE